MHPKFKKETNTALPKYMFTNVSIHIRSVEIKPYTKESVCKINKTVRQPH